MGSFSLGVCKLRYIETSDLCGLCTGAVPWGPKSPEPRALHSFLRSNRGCCAVVERRRCLESLSWATLPTGNGPQNHHRDRRREVSVSDLCCLTRPGCLWARWSLERGPSLVFVVWRSSPFCCNEIRLATLHGKGRHGPLPSAAGQQA